MNYSTNFNFPGNYFSVYNFCWKIRWKFPKNFPTFSRSLFPQPSISTSSLSLLSLSLSPRTTSIDLLPAPSPSPPPLLLRLPRHGHQDRAPQLLQAPLERRRLPPQRCHRSHPGPGPRGGRCPQHHHGPPPRPPPRPNWHHRRHFVPGDFNLMLLDHLIAIAGELEVAQIWASSSSPAMASVLGELAQIWPSSGRARPSPWLARPSLVAGEGRARHGRRARARWRRGWPSPAVMAIFRTKFFFFRPKTFFFIGKKISTIFL